jgi:hypothetical protein
MSLGPSCIRGACNRKIKVKEEKTQGIIIAEIKGILTKGATASMDEAATSIEV